jgi:hypothetical protein
VTRQQRCERNATANQTQPNSGDVVDGAGVAVHPSFFLSPPQPSLSSPCPCPQHTASCNLHPPVCGVGMRALCKHQLALAPHLPSGMCKQEGMHSRCLAGAHNVLTQDCALLPLATVPALGAHHLATCAHLCPKPEVNRSLTSTGEDSPVPKARRG